MRQQKRRGFLFGLLAVVLATITGLMFTSQIAALERQIGDRQQVVVVKEPVAPRSLLTPEVLEVKEIPRMFAHPSYVQSIEDIVNQRIAVIPLEPGAIVRQTDIAPINGLEAGWRAVSLGVNPVAVLADRVQTGSRVDVVVSYETSYLDEQGQEVEEKRTETLLSDVEVLAVAGGPQTPVARSSAAEGEDDEGNGGFLNRGGTTGNDSEPPEYKLRDVVIATLKVKPEDAQRLAYMDTYATDIRLSLRRADDRAVEPVKPLTEGDLR